MKTFEEKWTAWLDDQLTGEELAEFKAALPSLSVAELEKAEALKLGNLLRERIGVRAMSNEAFFDHQLRAEIERDTPAEPVPAPHESWWPIGRLLWTGAASLAIFALCTFFILRDKNVGGQSTYLTQIQSARVDPVVSPDATISIFEHKDDKVTVVWVDGFESLPSEFAAK